MSARKRVRVRVAAGVCVLLIAGAVSACTATQETPDAPPAPPIPIASPDREAAAKGPSAVKVTVPACPSPPSVEPPPPVEFARTRSVAVPVVEPDSAMVAMPGPAVPPFPAEAPPPRMFDVTAVIPLSDTTAPASVWNVDPPST